MKQHLTVILSCLLLCGCSGDGNTRSFETLAGGNGKGRGNNNGGGSGGSGGSIKVQPIVEDASPWHVFDQATGVSVEVSMQVQPAKKKPPVECQWIDGEGRELGPPIVVTKSRQTLSPPSNAPGYYGLVFSSSNGSVAFPPQPAGFPSRPYGFAVIDTPPASPGVQVDRSTPFGVIQGDIDDPYLTAGSGSIRSGVHLKTMTWEHDPSSWQDRLERRHAAGHTELPLVNNAPWDTDDTVAVGTSQLDEIATKIGDRIAAAPFLVDQWQIGLEENGGSPYQQPFYFANLASKIQRVRQVADSHNPALQLVYSTRGFDTDEFDQLLASSAFRDGYDILAQDPYRWPDFPSPEGWLADHIRDLRQRMDANGQQGKPLWIGELGLPVRGNNDPNGFFGYPSSGAVVPGSTPHAAAMYLTKANMIAWSEGIERIYLYNYQDRGNDIDYAEHHFGLRAYPTFGDVGHPRPSYVAYVNLLRHLKGTAPVTTRRPRPDLYVFEFQVIGSTERRIVSWVYPPGRHTVDLSELSPGLSSSGVSAAFDLYGAPTDPIQGSEITIDERPVYVRVR